MGSVYPRGNKLWIRFKGPDGKWTQSKTDLSVGQERQARKLLERVESKIAAGVEFGEKDAGPLTVARYSERWLEERRQLGVADWQNDQARLRDHVNPRIGSMRLDEVRPRHLIALIKALRTGGKLAPKTIYNVYSVLKGLFRDASISELIESSPCVLTKYQLGANVDADPEWRSTAVYTRSELETLLSDERVPTDRHMMYALEGLGGLRHGEAAGLRWRHYDPTLVPLGALLIATSYNHGRTKTGIARRVPVHPVLAAMLAEWKLRGWAAMMGRPPAADDLVVPMSPEHSARRRGKLKGDPMRSKTYSFKRIREDLVALGFRHRRGHDLRRTMISLARTDGARRDLLELCTHNPSKKSSTIDLYTEFPWDSLCAEVAKLNVRRSERGQLIELPQAVAVNGEGAGEPIRSVLPLATGLATSTDKTEQSQLDTEWRRRESKPALHISVERGRARSSEDSDGISPDLMLATESASASENDQTELGCSNVASEGGGLSGLVLLAWEIMARTAAWERGRS